MIVIVVRNARPRGLNTVKMSGAALRDATATLVLLFLATFAIASPLLEAVKSDDVASIETLLRSSAAAAQFLNAKDENSFTALHWAVRMGSMESARRLLKAGAQRHMAGPFGYTALHMAVVTRNNAMVPLLLSDHSHDETGFLLARLDDDGLTALHVASGVGNWEAASLLLDAGADPDFPAGVRAQLQRPLHVACEQGHAAVAVALIDSGASVDADAEHALSPLCIAVREGHAELIVLLHARGADLATLETRRCGDGLGIGIVRGRRWKKPGSASISASTSASESVAAADASKTKQLARSATALVQLGRRGGATACAWLQRLLRRAASADDEALITALVDAGALQVASGQSTNAVQQQQYAKQQQQQRGQQLHGALAGVSDGWSDGWPPLCIASAMGHASSVAALLRDPRHGADAAVCAFGRSPLAVAAQSGWGAAVHALLRGGARADAADVHGVCTLAHAAHGAHSHVVRQLLRALALDAAGGGWVARREQIVQAVLMASAVGAAAGSSRGEEATSNSGSRDARADVADEREGGAVADGGGDDDDNQVKDSEDSVSGARTMRLLWRALDGLLTAEAEEDRYQIPRLAGDSASSGSDQGAEDAASTARGTALRLAAARGRRDEVTGLLEEAAQAHTIGASGLRSGWAASVWAAAQIAAVGGDDWLGRRLLSGLLATPATDDNTRTDLDQVEEHESCAADASAAPSSAGAPSSPTSPHSNSSHSSPLFETSRWRALLLNGAREAVWAREAAPALGMPCPKLAARLVWREELGRSIRGLVAAEAVRAGEEVCAVPFEHTLSRARLALTDLFGSGFARRYGLDGGSRATELTAVFVLREASRDVSRWKPWIHTHLEPSPPEGVPATWLLEEAEAEQEEAREEEVVVGVKRREKVDEEEIGKEMRGSRRGLDGLSRHSRRLAEATYARFAGAYDRIFPDAFERFASVLAQGGACDHGLRVGGSGSEVEAATDAESAAATGATAIATSTDGRGAGGASVETCLRRIYSRSAFVRMCLTLESRGFGLMGRGEGPVWVPWFDFANHPAEGVGRAGRAVQLDIRYDVERHSLILSSLGAAAAGEELHYLYHQQQEEEGGVHAGSDEDGGACRAPYQCCRDERFLNAYGFAPQGMRACRGR